MVIKTKGDWIALAKQTVPLLPDYMASQMQVDSTKVETELAELLEAEDWPMLLTRFNEIWAWLPDRPSIRVRPFFDLCDLCSEAWALEEVH